MTSLFVVFPWYDIICFQALEATTTTTNHRQPMSYSQACISALKDQWCCLSADWEDMIGTASPCLCVTDVPCGASLIWGADGPLRLPEPTLSIHHDRRTLHKIRGPVLLCPATAMLLPPAEHTLLFLSWRRMASWQRESPFCQCQRVVTNLSVFAHLKVWQRRYVGDTVCS